MTGHHWQVEHGGVRSSTALKIEMAIRVADAFRDRTPTHLELQERYGMSRATAYRWLNAMRAARGQTSKQGNSNG